MTLANKITMVRIAMIPVFIVFALLGGTTNATIALILFCVASFTDFLDGYVARKYNQVSDFGKFVDPLADKLLVTAALVIFVQHGWTPAWMVFVILAREFIITSLRNVAAAKGTVMAAAWSGKVKTCVQIAGVIVIFLLEINGPDGALSTAPVYAYTLLAANWAMLLITLYSGWEYLSRNWVLIADGAVGR